MAYNNYLSVFDEVTSFCGFCTKNDPSHPCRHKNNVVTLSKGYYFIHIDVQTIPSYKSLGEPSGSVSICQFCTTGNCIKSPDNDFVVTPNLKGGVWLHFSLDNLWGKIISALKKQPVIQETSSQENHQTVFVPEIPFDWTQSVSTDTTSATTIPPVNRLQALKSQLEQLSLQIELAKKTDFEETLQKIKSWDPEMIANFVSQIANFGEQVNV